MALPVAGRARRNNLSPLARQVLLYSLFLLPAVFDLVEGWLGWLGPKPYRECLHDFGRYAFRFLLVSLMVTPLRRFAGMNLMLYRRPLGLLAFTYAALHITLYLTWARGLDPALIRADFTTRPFLSFGLLAFVILCVLAATSTRKSIMRLGKRWAPLHRTVYVAMVLACVHYSIAFKVWRIEPFIYAAIAAAVLATRLLPKTQKSRPTPV
ncbi:sulfoxide reductase heme-binding subunit YedZ [Acetobacter fabarum]|uniref:sulfite oxidase heme-binding subunit YedZ n=1 Tax=Acetobacter fabarum TaxID=483199 RepID=UPI00312B9A54